MLKATLHAFLLLAVVVSGIRLAGWYFNSAQIPTNTIQNTLINKVQAKPAPHIAPPSAQQLTTHQSLLAEQTALEPAIRYKTLKTHLTLQFEALDLQLTLAEQNRLSVFLDQALLDGSYQVSIASGPPPAKNNSLLPQIAKLRAQTIARLIYPYTQQITMRYHPEMSEGSAVVEFVPVPLHTTLDKPHSF